MDVHEQLDILIRDTRMASEQLSELSQATGRLNATVQRVEVMLKIYLRVGIAIAVGLIATAGWNARETYRLNASVAVLDSQSSDIKAIKDQNRQILESLRGKS